jgi:hypothetical protein
MLKPSMMACAALVALVFWSQDVFACATCFGNEDDSQTHGLNGAIITMLAVTYTLFFSMAVAAFLLWKRNQRKIAASSEENIVPGTVKEVPHV